MSRYRTDALIYHTEFGFNVLPVRGKRPNMEWDRWQSEKETLQDIESMDWDNCTGTGLIMGINDLRLIDIDRIEDYDFLEELLKDLGLPEKYPWVVQSGSGEGFHVSIRCKVGDDLTHPVQIKLDTPLKRGIYEMIGGEKAVYKFNMRNENICKHIELRWKDCQTVFPYSRHESGGMYRFYYDEPKEAPVYIEWEKLIGVIEKYCVLNRETQDDKRKTDGFEKNKERSKCEKIDKEKLESALKYLTERLPEGCYEEWYRIGFALVPLGAEGERYFVELSLANPNYKDTEEVIKRKYADLVKDYDGRISVGTIYHIAEEYGWKKPAIRFWSVDENRRVRINRTRFKRFLESEGFCKYRIESSAGSNYLFIRIEDNIIEEISQIDVKEFVMNYLDQLPIEEFEGTSKGEVIDIIIKSNNQIFTDQFLEFLITKNIEIQKDRRDNAFIYFKNGFISITKENTTFNEYKKLEGYVWKKHIIRRDYVLTKKRSIFEELIFNICRHDRKRYDALKSGIGYLLHTYKDPSLAKAIVLIDEKLSEGAFGRSGKGLVMKAIGHIRNVVFEDGRNFNPSKNFAFQRVKADTNIIAIEDIKERFPFEKLFSIITDGIAIEKKNKDEIYLGFSESPKVVMSTNFTISGVDDSTVDRQFIVEFSDYYSLRHKPQDDFGKLLFEGFDNDEWNEFDCFMIECLQFYLRNGLVEYEHVNLNKKKLIDETASEFEEFIEVIELNREHDKKELYENFIKEYQDYDPIGAGKLTQGKFTRWLKVFGRIKGYDVRESKSGAKRSIEFVKDEKRAA